MIKYDLGIVSIGIFGIYSLFPVLLIASTSHYSFWTYIEFKSQLGETVKIQAASDLSGIEYIYIQNEYGEFNIPKKYIDKLKSPDLTTARLVRSVGTRWVGSSDLEFEITRSLHLEFSFYDGTNESEIKDNEDYPLVRFNFEGGKLRDRSIRRLITCENETANKCWKWSEIPIDLAPSASSPGSDQ